MNNNNTRHIRLGEATERHRLQKLACMIGALLLICRTYGQVVYHDASEFPLLGKATTSGSRYERFPDSLERISRPVLWRLSRNSAGLAIRFRSNSTRIDLKWENLYNNRMNHMTDTGVRGLDLYCWKGKDGWRFVNSARPGGKSYNQATVIANMRPTEREYMLYLPLYDGLTSLQIGVDSLSYIGTPELDYPIRQKPVVFYGTSILQGGCASRPGMAHTNIISRRLNRECINLGFSGNGKLDLEVARIMAEIDAGVFVLDFVPNASVEQMKERMLTFYRIIRDKHPDTPIIFIEDPIFTHTRYDERIAEEVRKKNETLHGLFDHIKRELHDKRVTLISSRKMLGDDGEATVDGIHFTDVGMTRYADLVCPVIRKALK